MNLTGVRVVQSKYILSRQQIRFPRSKRKRMKKKWAKQEKNYGMVPGMYWWNFKRPDCCLMVHPDLYAKLLRSCK